MDYAALRDELVKPDYDGLTDEQIADLLNSETVPILRPVRTIDMRAVLLASGEWGAISLLSRQVVAMTDPMAPAVIAAINAHDGLKDFEVLDLDRADFWPAFQAMLSGLQQSGVLSAQTAGVLLAMRETMTSRGAQIFGGHVEVGDVQTARNY